MMTLGIFKDSTVAGQADCFWQTRQSQAPPPPVSHLPPGSRLPAKKHTPQNSSVIQADEPHNMLFSQQGQRFQSSPNEQRTSGSVNVSRTEGCQEPVFQSYSNSAYALNLLLGCWGPALSRTQHLLALPFALLCILSLSAPSTHPKSSAHQTLNSYCQAELLMLKNPLEAIEKKKLRKRMFLRA